MRKASPMRSASRPLRSGRSSTAPRSTTAPRSLLAARLCAQATGAALLGSAAAAAGRTSAATATSGWGEQALLSWVCALLACAAAVACARLALVWTLAATVLALGPHGTIGGASMRLLRVLSPALARRTAAAAVIASALASVPLAAAQADDGHRLTAPRSDRTISRHADAASLDRTHLDRTHLDRTHLDLTPVDATSAGTDASANGTGRAERTRAGVQAVLGSRGTEPSSPTERPAVPPSDEPPSDADSGTGPSVAPEPPPLGWGETAGTPSSVAAPSASPPETPTGAGGGTAHPDSPSDSAAPESSSDAPAVIEVGPGDTLWSISDDLLGPGPDSPARIASAWPALWEANISVIGTDPDSLTPGQVLVVPPSLTHQPSAAAPRPSQEES